MAQLVEHNLAKVGVASSSLVFRSQSRSKSIVLIEVFRALHIEIETKRRGGGIGRRATLRG